jgi:glc operon protein GlcG
LRRATHRITIRDVSIDHLTLAATMAAALAAFSAAAQAPSRPELTLDRARQIAAAAEAEARKNAWKVAVAIVDEAGRLILFERLDGTTPVAIDIALAKARTAANWRRPTKALEEEVSKEGRTALLAVAGIMPLEGGLPLLVDGQVVGAIGVSGVTGTQDAQVASAGVAALR